MGFPHVTTTVDVTPNPEGRLKLPAEMDCVVVTQSCDAQLTGHTFIVQSLELQVRDKPSPYISMHVAGISCSPQFPVPTEFPLWVQK